MLLNSLPTSVHAEWSVSNKYHRIVLPDVSYLKRHRLEVLWTAIALWWRWWQRGDRHEWCGTGRWRCGVRRYECGIGRWQWCGISCGGVVVLGVGSAEKEGWYSVGRWGCGVG